jgi:hypothetical protein
MANLSYFLIHRAIPAPPMTATAKPNQSQLLLLVSAATGVAVAAGTVGAAA